MFYGIPYYIYSESEGFVYSVDSMRITFTIDNDVSEKIFQSDLEYLHGIFSCIDLQSDPEISHRKIANYKSASFKHLVAFVVISLSSEDGANGFIHFNPNRLFKSPRAYFEIKHFLSLCSSVTVKKCDVAIDMPYDITSLTPLKSRKNMIIYVESQKNYTFYWGKRNDEGYAKLYSKSLKNKLDEAVTRLEITLGNPEDGDWNKVLINSIPPIYISPYEISHSPIKLTSPEKVIIKLANCLLHGILQRTMLFRMLELYEDKARRKIIKNYILAGSQQLQVDFCTINDLVKKVIYDITGKQIE